MKKTFFLTLIAIALSTALFAQGSTRDCACPENQFTGVKAEAVYNFSNGRAIALCGFKMKEDSDVTYSEFVLSVCGEDKIIDFWDAMTVCRLTSHSDTLFVEELYVLPTGDDFQSEDIVWTVEKIYFTGKEVKRKKSVNNALKKYSRAQMEQVLKSYRNAGSSFDESKMDLANQLFVAALSGSPEARANFIQFMDRFDVPSGALSHEYRVLKKMLLQWETDRKQKN